MTSIESFLHPFSLQGGAMRQISLDEEALNLVAQSVDLGAER